MAHILEDRGYSTAVELQMDPAVERLQTERFDAIVCEVRMPGKKDGIWLFEWLRENRPEMLGKTLFLSGDLISERVKAFVAECPQAVLPKPFAIQEFVKRVDGFFQQAVGGSPSEGAPG
jgi:two-component system NtrC family sensor kinase